MISVPEAEEKIQNALPVLDTEWCSYAQCAGRILRRSIIADRPLPPYARVMMDGYAVCLGEGEVSKEHRWDLAGTAYAGEPQKTLEDSSKAMEVMTGAVLPRGADTVIPLEWLKAEEKRITLNPEQKVEPGQYVHPQGSDYPRGAVLVEARRPLSSREIAVAISNGKTELEVSRQPRLALISSGDELVDPEAIPEPHQIRRSNTLAIRSLIESQHLGQTESFHVEDRPGAIRSCLQKQLREKDILVLSGGVSKGQKDFFPEILKDLGVEQWFHRVAQRPGKPFWFGKHPEGALVFAFPGNPVSSLVGAHRYLLPALEAMMAVKKGPQCGLALGKRFHFGPPLTLFLPVRRLQNPETGSCIALPCPVSNSGDYASLVATDGFIQLPPERNVFEVGEVFPFHPWR